MNEQVYSKQEKKKKKTPSPDTDCRVGSISIGSHPNPICSITSGKFTMFLAQSIEFGFKLGLTMYLLLVCANISFLIISQTFLKNVDVCKSPFFYMFM